MYLPVPVIEPTSSVFLGECVTHWAKVVDEVGGCNGYRGSLFLDVHYPHPRSIYGEIRRQNYEVKFTYMLIQLY